MVPAPTKFEYHRDGGTGHQGYFDRLQEELVAGCRAADIDALPTVQALHGSDFWLRDGHWNPGGHDKLAEVIAARLVAGGFAQRR